MDLQRQRGDSGGAPSRPARALGAGGWRGTARALVAALPYPLLLAAGTLVLDSQPAATRASWLRYASTDLSNLAAHPVPSMVLSAVVCDEDLLAWVVLGVAGLAALGLRLGAWRALAVVFAVHVLATLASQGLVARRIGSGAVPTTARVMSDVGPSYVIVAALVGSLAYGTLGGRVVGGLGFGVLAPSIFDGLTDLDVAAVGHVVSIACVLLLAWVPARRARRVGRVAGPEGWPSADSNRGP